MVEDSGGAGDSVGGNSTADAASAEGLGDGDGVGDSGGLGELGGTWGGAGGSNQAHTADAGAMPENSMASPTAKSSASGIGSLRAVYTAPLIDTPRCQGTSVPTVPDCSTRFVVRLMAPLAPFRTFATTRVLPKSFRRSITECPRAHCRHDSLRRQKRPT